MKFDVVSIGTATVDVVAKLRPGVKISGCSSAQCFPLGAKMEMEGFCIASGGGATNTAVTFKRMGFSTGAVFEVGTDILGDYVIRELRDEKVSVFPSRNKTLPTAGSVILVGARGERTVLTHRGAANDLSFKEIPFSKINAPWWYIVPGGIAPLTITKIIKQAKRTGARIALNPSLGFINKGLSHLRPTLKDIDMLLVNDTEAAQVVGMLPNKSSMVFNRLDKMTKGILVVTSGNKGVMVSDGNRVWQAGIFKNKKVIDRLGAGDAFGSGFTAGLIRMGELCRKGKCNPRAIEYAIRLGSANATSVVEALGAKAGILDIRTFERSSRWKNLRISIKA